MAVIMKVDDFSISNASLKELIITDAPLNYLGSIRRAFPDLVCFCEGVHYDKQSAETLPAVYDLMLLSDQLKELVLYRPKHLAAVRTPRPIPIAKFYEVILKSINLYPDLWNYFHNISLSDDCELRFVFKLGAKLSKLSVIGVAINAEAKRPICVQEDNNIISFDIAGSSLPNTPPVLIGLRKLKYLNIENTGIKRLPKIFLLNFSSLEVLKLSKLDLGDFLESIDGNFFGSCASLSDIYSVNCNITNVPTAIFSQSFNIHRLDLSKNYLRTFDFDLQNCTRLGCLNFSENKIESITQQRIDELSQLALRKTGGNNLLVDLSYNKLHCLCNSTQFVKWLQRSPTESNIKFRGFDSYTCLYPNGSTVRLSEVSVNELEKDCNFIQTLVNGSDCSVLVTMSREDVYNRCG